jgi:hypothetical protein
MDVQGSVMSNQTDDRVCEGSVENWMIERMVKADRFVTTHGIP